jgi:hypothetical protein
MTILPFLVDESGIVMESRRDTLNKLSCSIQSGFTSPV